MHFTECFSIKEYIKLVDFNLNTDLDFISLQSTLIEGISKLSDCPLLLERECQNCSAKSMRPL